MKMKNTNRGITAAAGVAGLFCGGVVYAWSIMSAPISRDFAQWTKAQLSATFTITMIMFCIGCMLAGILLKKVRPSFLVLASALLFLAGFMLVSGLNSLTELYLSFGVICGFAAGIVYNAVMGTVSKWYPDKPGYISGILLTGFGLSAFVIGKLYQMFTPAVSGGWRDSFRVLSIAVPAVLCLCAAFICAPEPGTHLPEVKKKEYGSSSEMNALQMMKTPSFWLYYGWAIVMSAAGLALVSQAAGIASETGTGVDAGTVATVVGLISVFNAVGRIISGILYDRVGRSVTMNCVNALFVAVAAILALGLKTGKFALVVAGFIVGGLAYGGVTPTNSAFIGEYFGRKNFPVNFSVINTNLIISSLGSTVAGALYDKTLSYMSMYVFIVCLAAAGTVMSALISMTDRKNKYANQKSEL